MAIESFSNFFKKALVGFGDWFQVEGPKGDPLAPDIIRSLMLCHLEDCGPNGDPFATVVSDGTKVAALEAVMIFKVHGYLQTKTQHRVERGLEWGAVGPRVTDRLAKQDVTSWKLMVDLIRPEDHYKDPTGRGLYEVHRCETDLSHVIEWAEACVYDVEAVKKIEEDFAKEDQDSRSEELRGQDEATPPSFRKRVVIEECYGTILDSKGHAAHRNVMWTVANDKYIIRKPVAITERFWHGQCPIISIPLIRVPFSVLHKALADHMVPLNNALEELYNLMFDGGLSSVWGIKQIRTDWLEDPRQVSDGIAQGMTLQLNSNAPADAKVLEQVATGQVPQEAMAMFAQTDREFQTAALSNELQLGQLPSKQVRATEIVEASQSRAVTIEGLVRDVEKGLEKVLRLVWMTLLQHADDLATDDVVAAIGQRATLILARMSPAERFAKYATPCKFKVFGLSAVLARVQEFTKLSAVLGLVSTNPILAATFMRRYSLDKTLDSILRSLNINPQQLQPDELEVEQQPERMQQIQKMMLMMGGAKKTGGNGMPGTDAGTMGDTTTGAQINQEMTNSMAPLGI